LLERPGYRKLGHGKAAGVRPGFDLLDLSKSRSSMSQTQPGFSAFREPGGIGWPRRYFPVSNPPAGPGKAPRRSVRLAQRQQVGHSILFEVTEARLVNDRRAGNSVRRFEDLPQLLRRIIAHTVVADLAGPDGGIKRMKAFGQIGRLIGLWR